jgi:hypothetical protein
MPLIPNQPSPSRAPVPSPLTTLVLRLTASHIDTLPYGPDFFPGARDVQTPFGSLRVYEWGLETGRKIMLLHGDATPSALDAGIAGD